MAAILKTVKRDQYYRFADLKMVRLFILANSTRLATENLKFWWHHIENRNDYRNRKTNVPGFTLKCGDWQI